MPEFGIIAGQTDKTIYVRLRDSTTGLAKTGLTFESAGAVCSFTLPGANRVDIPLVIQTANGTHTDGGFVAVDGTNCKGLYRLDLPDAAIASGRFSVVSIEFNTVIEESSLVPLVAAVAAVRDDTPIADGMLSLHKGEVRNGTGRPKLFWDFTDFSAATDFSTGSTGTLTLSEKFDDKSVVSTVDIDSVTDQGSDVYRAIFAIDETVADSLILADDRAARMTYRVEVRHAASGAVLTPDGAHGDLLVK